MVECCVKQADEQSSRSVGIYLRKSSAKQGEHSLPAQERIIRSVISDLQDP